MTKGLLYSPLATTESILHQPGTDPSLVRRRTLSSAPPVEGLHEFVRCAEKIRPAARVDIARIVARLEVVLTACVRVGRLRVQQVPDAERDLQVLVDQPGVRAVEMEDAVLADHAIRRIFERSRNVPVVALVLLRERDAPRREFPVQVRVMP